MDRELLIKKAFVSVKKIMARYQVGLKYEEQTKIIISNIVYLTYFLKNNGEKDLFWLEWRKIKDHLRAFASDSDYKRAQKSLFSLGRQCKSKDDLQKVFEKRFFPDFIKLKLHLITQRAEERALQDCYFYNQPRHETFFSCSDKKH